MRATPVSLSELIQRLPIDLVRGDPGAPIAGVVEDSREVTPGALFIARPGLRADGRAFIDDAIGRGAIAILTDAEASVPDGVALLLAADVPRATAMLAERFCGDPGQRLKLVGITGTNGKTTVGHLVHQLMNASSLRCGLMGTVEVDDGRTRRPASLTTPPAIEISRLLGRMVDHDCVACAMEVSSHALEQDRTGGLEFDIAIFTNLSGDHMDYHGSEDGYLRAKAKLFESLTPEGTAIVNVDDPAAMSMLARVHGDALHCSLIDTGADCYAEVGKASIRGVACILFGPWGQWAVDLPLAGRHNVMNTLQAAAACHRLGADEAALQEQLARCVAPPGRLEPVGGDEAGLTVLVDYAHTDDALDNVLRALRPLVEKPGALAVVFGCGGDRDRSKRPRMAEVACQHADRVVITSDNPRTEDPQSIVDEAFAGVPVDRRTDTVCIVDRAAAIGHAIETASRGDVILIAGKGHEDYQVVGTTKRPFDDREVAAEAIRGCHLGVTS